MSNRVLPVSVPPAECGWEEGDGLFTIRDVLHDGVHLGVNVICLSKNITDFLIS